MSAFACTLLKCGGGGAPYRRAGGSLHRNRELSCAFFPERRDRIYLSFTSLALPSSRRSSQARAPPLNFRTRSSNVRVSCLRRSRASILQEELASASSTLVFRAFSISITSTIFRCVIAFPGVFLVYRCRSFFCRGGVPVLL